MKKSCFQVMTWKHKIFIMIPWLLYLCTHFIWKLFLYCFQNRPCFHCSYNQKKSYLCLKKIFYIFYCTGLISHQWFGIHLACSVPVACLQRTQHIYSSFLFVVVTESIKTRQGRPSTDELHHFEEKEEEKKKKILMTHDTWNVTPVTWHLTSDM